MRKARIFQKGTRATQSGKARSNLWILEAEPVEGKRPDPLMGWAGSGDTETQVILSYWGGPLQWQSRSMGPGDDPYSHVLAGDILSPGQTAQTVDLIVAWAKGL